MEARADVWRIADAPKVPEWIMALEKELASAITEHQAFIK